MRAAARFYKLEGAFTTRSNEIVVGCSSFQSGDAQDIVVAVGVGGVAQMGEDGQEWVEFVRISELHKYWELGLRDAIDLPLYVNVGAVALIQVF